MAPGELKLATSWPRDCMKADISHTYIKPTNSLGKPMICCIPHAQFASKVAQVRAKIRSKSDPSRSRPDPIRFKSDPSRSNPIQSGPIRSKSGSGSVHGHSRSDPDGHARSEITATHPNPSQIIPTHPKSSQIIRTQTDWSILCPIHLCSTALSI